ncbi:MAG: peptidoglycan-binding protein [Luteimonas sp.]
MSLNPVSSSDSTQRGLPPPSDTTQAYTAQRGDTLSEIARAHGISLEGLLAANPQVRNPDVIYPDQTLTLPAGARPLDGDAAVADGPASVQHSASASSTPTLERNDRGPAVSDLQTRLAAAGFSPGTADGIFGARTESAVRSYQSSRGIEVDGVVGPNTWAQLNGAPAVEKPPATEPVAPGDVAQVSDGPSNARIASLHPELRGQAAEFVNRVEQELGITLRVTQGFRTYAEQDALYAQGRTTPGDIVTNARGGYSNHNFATAFDVVEVRPNGSINWSPDWDAIGQIGTDMGLEWGGNWTTFVDRPHFQLDAGLSTADMRSRIANGNVDADGFVNLR